MGNKYEIGDEILVHTIGLKRVSKDKYAWFKKEEVITGKIMGKTESYVIKWSSDSENVVDVRPCDEIDNNNEFTKKEE